MWFLLHTKYSINVNYYLCFDEARRNSYFFIEHYALHVSLRLFLAIIFIIFTSPVIWILWPFVVIIAPIFQMRKTDLMKLASNEAITCNPQSFWFQSLCSHLLCYIVRLGREFWDKPAFKNDRKMWCDLASYLRMVQARTKVFCLPQPLICWEQMHPPNKMRWRRQWHPTPVFLPGKSRGRRSLVGCGPRGH